MTTSNRYTNFKRMRKATLILEDGSRFCGTSFGYEQPTSGEVVFNTAMTGYPESLTDPSYAGQLMTLTYPLIGNYGVPPCTSEDNDLPHFMESERIHAEAVIVSDYSETFSHWNAAESLSDWLKREHVPGITSIDTRRLTKVLRQHGVMHGRIVFDGETGTTDETPQEYGKTNFVEKVSCKDIKVYTRQEVQVYPLWADVPRSSSKRVVLVDCGVKANILRCLLKRDVEIVRVPWDYDFTDLEYDGLFLSNGPGDPNTCEATVRNIRQAMKDEHLPIFGICMGNQLLAKAAGAKIYKLKYGHRSHNQPVRMVGTDRCFITAQNHGYAVASTSLSADWEPLFVNMNDGSNEGIRHTSRPWFSVQFHPEAASGPTDTEFLFDEFVKLL